MDLLKERNTIVTEDPIQAPSELTQEVRHRRQRIQSQRRKRWVLRSLGYLVVGVCAFCVVILAQRGQRHKNIVMKDATKYAHLLESRVGDSGRLPLNLSPHPSPPDFRMWFQFDCFTHNEAKILRNLEPPILLAYSNELRLPFRTNGRGVVLYKPRKQREKKACTPSWLTRPEFDRLIKRQRDFIEQQSGSPKQ